MGLIDEVYIILNFCMKHNTHKTHYNVAVELLVCHPCTSSSYYQINGSQMNCLPYPLLHIYKDALSTSMCMCMRCQGEGM